MKKRSLLSTVLVCLICAASIAQSPLAKNVKYSNSGTITSAEFDSTNHYSDSNPVSFLLSVLNLSINDGFQVIKSQTDNQGWLHQRCQQTYKNVSVENGQYIIHSYAGNILELNGKFIQNLNNIDVSSFVSESVALNTVLDGIESKEYLWNIPFYETLIKKAQKDNNATNFPKGKLIISKVNTNGHQHKLMWQFNVHTANPFSEWNVLVDATSNKIAQLYNATCNSNTPGVAVTKYSGTRDINCSLENGEYSLKETNRNNSIDEIVTYSQDYINSPSTITKNNSTNWDANWDPNKRKQHALDAHWGIETVVDYWNEKHGRNSFDDSKSGVTLIVESAGDGDDNAYWFGTNKSIVFGGGQSIFKPLTSLDLCGHEFGHGVTQDLNFLNSIPGSVAASINEGYSDIWAACGENFANEKYNLNKDVWKYGEEVMLRSVGCIRNLKNPKLGYNHPSPDCYWSETWYDASYNYKDHHYLNGVLNKWFYIITKGETRTNDLGDSYNIAGLGFKRSSEIALGLLNYLLPDATYLDARAGSISWIKANGNSSFEMEQITNAWFAVGVGTAYNSVLPSSPACLGNTTFSIIDNSNLNNSPFQPGIYVIKENISITSGMTVEFNNATVVINAGVKIIVENGGTLKIHGSHLSTCDGRWGGIQAGNSAQVIIDGYSNGTISSLIEDADIAVNYDFNFQSTDGNSIILLQLNNTIFNRNNIGLLIGNTIEDKQRNPLVPVQVYNCIFTSRKNIALGAMASSWSSVSILKNSTGINYQYPQTPQSYAVPFIDENTYPISNIKNRTILGYYSSIPTAGIIVNGIKFRYDKYIQQNISYYLGIRIGDDGSQSDANTTVFDNLSNGIKSNWSNLSVRNCVFQMPNTAIRKGVGVNINNLDDCSIDIATTTKDATPNNAFFGLNTAIFSLEGKEIKIKNCDIYSADGKDIKGIVVDNSNFESINIQDNKIVNISEGIIVSTGVDKTTSIRKLKLGDIAVIENEIKAEFTSRNNINNYITNAINLTSWFGYGTSNLFCNNNKIQDAYNGIKLSNWNINKVEVKENTIALKTRTLKNDENEYFGISLEGGFAESVVEENIVTGSFNLKSTNQTGILLSMASNAIIQCNTVSNNFHGFRFYGSNPQTKWWDNKMTTDNKYGMTLDEGGIIGQQGDIYDAATNNNCAANNNWQFGKSTTYWNLANLQFMTYCQGSDATNSPLVIKNPSITPEINPEGSGKAAGNGGGGAVGVMYSISNGSIKYVVGSNPNSSVCKRCATANGSYNLTSSIGDIEILNDIANGSVSLPNDDAVNRLNAMQDQLYKLAQQKAEIQLESTDVAQFVQENQFGSLDYIYSISNLLITGKYDVALQLLNSWQEQTVLDDNYHKYFEWITQMAKDPNFKPDEAEVLQYANKCAVKNGVVVYAYRNLYNILTGTINKFEEDCNGTLGSRGVQQEKSMIRIKPRKEKPFIVKAQGLLKLYPNPSNGIITINKEGLRFITVRDVLGRIVLTKEINNTNSTTINLHNKGFYIVKITDKEGKESTEKVIVK